jgi:tRNA threonylcarbamoyladenosine biosynthesis protein TsaB
MILAINTSTREYSVAILGEDGILASEYLVSEGEGHFGGLMPALDFVFTSSKLSLKDVKAIAVAIGPGSFTGLRVGLAAAKGMCHGLEIPIIGIPSLEALASQIPFLRLPIVPVLDSRRGELFTAQFTLTGDNSLVREKEDVSLRLEDFPSMLTGGPMVFIGNNFAAQEPLIRDVLGSKVLVAPAHYWNLRASSVGALAHKRFHAHDFDDPQGLDPVYLRGPDIRPNPFPLLPGSD